VSANWRPVHALEGSNLKPGWWTFYDRGRVVGYVQEFHLHGSIYYRGWDPDQLWVLGYATSRSAAAAALWAWDHATFSDD